jgi:hypothetical protein
MTDLGTPYFNLPTPKPSSLQVDKEGAGHPPPKQPMQGSPFQPSLLSPDRQKTLAKSVSGPDTC